MSFNFKRYMKRGVIGILAVFMISFFGIYYFTQITGLVSLGSLNDVSYDTSSTLKEDVTVTVLPQVVEANNPVNVLIDASKNHIYKDGFNVYKLTGTGQRGVNVAIIRDICTNKYTEGHKMPLGQTGSKCRGIFTVPISTIGLCPGDYEVEVEGYGRNQRRLFITDTFSIVKGRANLPHQCD